MLGAQRDQGRTLRRYPGWMSRITPIDKERYQAITEYRKRIGQTPTQGFTIGLVAAAGKHLADARASPQVQRVQALQVFTLCCPGHQLRRREFTDTKYPGLVVVGLGRVRADNLQVSCRAQGYQGIAGTPVRVAATDRGANT
jgi:hypothetical protein